ncbi:septation inhibitor protein [Bombella sp. ESL0378]|uniref:FtsB family cell division protein n=1 Tax=unclassified Bombella TaxID=2644098 RepID=UPI0012D98076|nr:MULTISPECIES: septation inhibitor protein [unclassified Bombella]MCT6856033.1 septation inhibitor protein [Bombella apis]MUG04576.1 septation inhibitor protein [Bombella sp. ESL0378]MUG90070.1 septation inhibitor protein [Bombella sp. ESL0385]
MVFVFLRRSVRAICAPLLFLLLAAYFVWNALHGELGIRAYQHQKTLQAEAQLALANAHAEQNIWRRRVLALNENALDSDMLDERSRAMLNDSLKGDLVIPYGDKHPLY